MNSAMQDKNDFDPEKIALIDFKMIKGQADTPYPSVQVHIL